jgi:hypothetical protein
MTLDGFGPDLPNNASSKLCGALGRVVKTHCTGIHNLKQIRLTTRTIAIGQDSVTAAGS